MAASDIDVDVLRSDFGDITGPRPRFTIFVSQHDRALAFSRRIGGDITRLGAINPNDEPYKSQMAKDSIVVIDLAKLKSGDSMNHGKFAESPAVVQLIGEQLIAGQTVTDASLSVGERIRQATLGATSAVSSTVGAVVSAPIAIVDPNTRRALGRQVGNIGDGLWSGIAAITGQ
jgi:esterase/lipase superfamily enzyme